MSLLKIIYVSILNIKPNDYNPNTHNADSFDGLLESMKLFGFTQPIVVDRNTMQIIDGEHRWRCASVLGIEMIPVCFLDLNDDQRRIATIIHNESRGKHNPKSRKLIEDHLASHGIDLDSVTKKNNIN